MSVEHFRTTYLRGHTGQSLSVIDHLLLVRHEVSNRELVVVLVFSSFVSHTSFNLHQVIKSILFLVFLRVFDLFWLVVNAEQEVIVVKELVRLDVFRTILLFDFFSLLVFFSFAVG